MNPKIDKNTKTSETCIDCGCEIESSNNIVNVNGDVLCRDCYESNYSTCNSCNDVFHNDDLHYQDGDIYCDDCFSEEFTTCYNCDETIRIDNAYLFDDKNYCETCYQDNFGCCDGCGEVLLNDDLYWSDVVESYYCESCIPPEIDGLYNYEYRPNPVYYRSINESKNDDHRYNLYFGIELEIESNGNDIASAIYNLPDFVYAKADSSISDGFEIVSHPCTYKWLRENPEKWNQILDLRKGGFRSYNTDTCGIHIHLSKNYFGTWHLYKFLKLFYENPQFILRISQRDECDLNTWATLNQKHPFNQTDESLIYKAKNKRGNYQRHTAINLQNRYTIEIRIFKGTLNPRSFWKNIEFVKAIVDFTLGVALKSITIADFKLYVIEHKGKYINLYNWMFKRGFYQDSLAE